ncbi:MAG: galactokinase [Phycisphaerales bacterium]|nr:galactokinase [Phycisphaerales bacterium]
MGQSAAPNGGDALVRAVRAHLSRFGVKPTLGATAPGRVNLIGEHVDYCGGRVLPIAIGVRTACVASPAADATRVFASDLGQRGGWSVGEPAPPGSWQSYALGVLEEVRGLPTRGACGPLDLTIASDVPIGAGLSSSAAFEVSLGLLLARAWGREVSFADLAAACHRAEHDYAGVPCGIMDQMVVAGAVAGHAMLLDCGTGEVRMTPVPKDAVLVVVDTGVRHRLGESEYPKRRAACERAAAILGVRALARADASEIGRLPEDLRPFARHVISEDGRTVRFASCLAGGDLAGAGRAMNESHESLRDDYRVSCAELDWAASRAASMPGVFGARMTGGGFGGSVIVLATHPGAQGLPGAISPAFEREFGHPCRVFEVTASEGARLEKV